MADDRIARALTQVPGMAAVDLFGGRVREIHLNVTPLTLRTHGLSLKKLSNLVKNTNFNSPSGHIASGLRRPRFGWWESLRARRIWER
jgi:HAE1 family hydrophobic/amphiphilic exporter-1